MKRVAFALLLVGTVSGTPAVKAGDWEQGFAKPPPTAQAWCYWWWLNGAASKEGIRRDFKEMKRQGISGALLFDAGQAGPDAPRGPRFMSAAWRQRFKYAVDQADRFGITLSVNLCSGWNCGGPWVGPEHAAKTLVGASTVVNGPGSVQVELPPLKAVQGYARTIAVLAHPLPSGMSAQAKITASSSYPKYPAALAMDDKDQTRWISNGDKPGMGPTPQKPEFLQFDYDRTWSMAGLYLKPYPDCGPRKIEVRCSADGRQYRLVSRATLEPGKAVTIRFDAVETKHVRVVFLSSYPFKGKASWNVQVAEIAPLSRAELNAPRRHRRAVWRRAHIIDLTGRLDEKGRLTWDVPSGAWEVLRIGYTLHGRKTKCVGSGPGGYEIDPMSAAAMESHFAETGAKLIADAGPLAGRTLQYFHIDSWELGQPTWTVAMREEFKKRRGYDPLLFLPSLLGKTVDDEATCQRFMEDYRRTAADLVAANYYGRLRALTIQGGLRGTHPESGGPFFKHWIDGLQCEGINDIPMGEFWKRRKEPDGPISGWPAQKNPSVKQAASAAHIYGKPICQAEAFTYIGAGDWTATPWNMKDIGDQAFCHGLTRYVLCFWVHQPKLNDIPGYQWANVGTHFDPNITWWHMSHAWLTYIARCQYLLRQGQFVADFAYFRGERIPGFIAPRDLQQPMRPAGFDDDALNAEVLLKRASAKNGRLALPDGMSYRYLVLPPEADWAVSPAVLKKIKELIEGGVTVVGSRPARAIGLMNYPDSDEQVSTIADALWGPRTPPSGQRQVGSGRVIWGRSLDEVVRADGLPADVEFSNIRSPIDNPKTRKLDWIHRRDGDKDIYFICNQTRFPLAGEVRFRVSGKQPELWDAVTGQRRDLPEWREAGGRVVVPLKFAPRQSWFVVFARPAERKARQGARNFAALKSVGEVSGPWAVTFDRKWGGPGRVVFEQLDDWSKRPEPGIRYYSGTATYRTPFDLPEALRQTSGPIYLDLGRVKNIASVRLNGKNLGVVWTAPWRVDITTAVKPTGNQLEIDVANLWPNRLIGDMALPPDKRYTVTNVKTYQKTSPLLESGLLGPVTVRH